MADKKDAMDVATSGNSDLHSEYSKEQIELMGGTFDDDLDSFVADPKARGDYLPEDMPEDDEDTKDEENKDAEEESQEAETPEAEEEGDVDEEEDAGVKDGSKDDSEADDQEKDDGDAKDEDAGKREENRIPKSRFDEVNARRKAAEEERDRLRAQLAAQEQGEKQEFDFIAAEKEFNELLISGKTDEAAAKRQEIREAERAEIRAEMQDTSSTTAEDAQLARDIKSIASEYEGKYPEFDPKNEAFSEDLMFEVQSMYSGYLDQVSSEFSELDAFTLAIDNVVRLYNLESADAEPSGDTKADEGEQPKTETKKTTKKTNIKEKLDQAKKAGADLASVGKAGDSAGDNGELPDITKLTDAEFDALPESTLRRLRGDTFTG